MQVEETEILTEILQESIDFIDNWFFDMELQNLIYEFDMAMDGAATMKAERKLTKEASM